MKRKVCILIGAAMLLAACGGKEYQPVTTTAESSTAAGTAVTEGKGNETTGEEQTDATAGGRQTAAAANAEHSDEAAAESGSETGDQKEDISLPGVLHVSKMIQNISDYDEAAGDPILTIDVAALTVNDPGYEALRDSVNSYWDGVWENMQEQHDQICQEAKEYHEGDYAAGYYTISRDARILRADSRIFSFLDIEETYTGGAHGSSYQKGVNMDAATGRQLTLQDVTSDYDQVYSAVMERLNQISEDGMLFEEYPDTVSKMFYDGDTSLEWTMDREGVIFYFNPYEIAPYAAGCIEVPLRFSEYPDLFRPEYVSDASGLIRFSKWGYENTFDVTGDGEADTLSVSAYATEDGSATQCTVSVNGVETVHEEYGDFAGAWIFYGGDGRVWCYVHMNDVGDWPILDVFELTGGTPVYVDKLTAMTLQEPGGSADCFAMSTRTDFLGRYQAWRDYHLGEDGMPEADTDYFDIYSYGLGDQTLTVKTEIPATLLPQIDGPDGGETTLPVGTVLRPARTDGESWMIFEMEDGSYCRVSVEGEPYSGTIGGVNEFDCFDGLFYAG